jgi:hypothetical protein
VASLVLKEGDHPRVPSGLSGVSWVHYISKVPCGRCAPPLFVWWCPPAVAPCSYSSLVWPSAVAPPSHGLVAPIGRCAYV